MTNPSYHTVAFRAKVPVYMGFDEQYALHSFHPTEEQDVSLMGWYFPETGMIELVLGINLYTGYSMSENWLKGLEKDQVWSLKLSKLGRIAYNSLTS